MISSKVRSVAAFSLSLRGGSANWAACCVFSYLKDLFQIAGNVGKFDSVGLGRIVITLAEGTIFAVSPSEKRES